MISIDELTALVAEITGRPVVLSADTPLAELGLDSLAVFELLVNLDERGVDLPEGLWESMRTVRDLEHHVRLRAEQRAP